MATVVHSRQGDTADLIADRYYDGDTSMVTAILEANPGLAALGPVLPHGTPITLPPRRQQTKPGLNLWD
ncbi:tail protein X [Telmatospirillum sp. J64-1]|uniref:tail protein X n=1 Tax=Telmatospirillum sp. J64-1 TaxID=2502183 RepID=UPI00115C9DC1|nr:tail protein X [Telmatospirillum sp. J64-1]